MSSPFIRAEPTIAEFESDRVTDYQALGFKYNQENKTPRLHCDDSLADSLINQFSTYRGTGTSVPMLPVSEYEVGHMVALNVERNQHKHFTQRSPFTISAIERFAKEQSTDTKQGPHNAVTKDCSTGSDGTTYYAMLLSPFQRKVNPRLVIAAEDRSADQLYFKMHKLRNGNAQTVISEIAQNAPDMIASAQSIKNYYKKSFRLNSRTLITGMVPVPDKYIASVSEEHSVVPYEI